MKVGRTKSVEKKGTVQRKREAGMDTRIVNHRKQNTRIVEQRKRSRSTKKTQKKKKRTALVHTSILSAEHFGRADMTGKN